MQMGFLMVFVNDTLYCLKLREFGTYILYKALNMGMAEYWQIHLQLH